MPVHLALLCLDILTIAGLALFGTRVALTYRSRPEAWLVLAVCVGAMAHFALARAEYAPWIPAAYRFDFGSAEIALSVIRNLTPGFFALLAHALFTDRPMEPWWLKALVLAQLAIELLSRWRQDLLLPEILSSLLHAVFAGLAIFWTARHWREDLVEARRRSRSVFALLLTVNGFAYTLLLRLIIPRDSLANYVGHVGLSALTALLVLTLVVRLTQGDKGSAFGLPRKAPPSRSTSADEDAAALLRLARLLEEKVHHEPRLTLARLAGRLELPEYRLRRLIHERMGHRNFNAFLHAHRVADAAQQLGDPRLRRTPILTIAFSVGYESVNTFNRGFREIMKVSPSEYRARREIRGESGE